MVKRYSLIVVATAALTLGLGACGADSDAASSARQQTHKAARTSPTAATASPSATHTHAKPNAKPRVPRHLVGKTMGAAKAKLARAGYSNIAVAGEHGGAIADSDKVVSAPEAGKRLRHGARIRLIAASPVVSSSSGSGSSSDAGTRCQTDENDCYVDGHHCATGSCVNKARGRSPDDVARQRDQWLKRHPGYCPAGDTGAVAPCRK